MYKSLLKTIMSKKLSVDDAYSIGQYILSGNASDSEIASLLTALLFKEESFELIAGFAQALKLYSKKMLPTNDKLIDVCGTGGDGSNTFNISTTVSLLLASRMTVAKHGNRSISSKSGSADVLKILNIPTPDSVVDIQNHLSKSKYSFLFAPFMHPNMKYVMPVRTALRIPTIFNIIGPLCNPFNLEYQVIGVFKESLLIPMAKALNHMGIKRAAVIHGHSHLDELSISGPNKVVYVINNTLEEAIINPEAYGITCSPIESLKGGSPKENAKITEDILKGIESPKLDVVALNAGLALFIGEQSETLDEGITLAFNLLRDKEGYKVLKSLRNEVTHVNFN